MVTGLLQLVAARAPAAGRRSITGGTYRFGLAIFFAPLVFVLGLVLLKWISAPLYWHVAAREDGLAEYLTSVAYLLAFLIGLSMAAQFRRQGQPFYGGLYLLLSLGFLFVSLEEISWGQRIFGLATPELLANYNSQGEINLHNVANRYYLHGAYIAVGGYGTFAHWILPRLGAVSFGRALPLVTPGPLLFFYFFTTFVLYIYYDYLSRSWLPCSVSSSAGKWVGAASDS